jgi:hypothetical protein
VPCWCSRRPVVDPQHMTGDRRFPPPWTVEEYRGISYIVRDSNNFAVAYVYFESDRADVPRPIS